MTKILTALVLTIALTGCSATDLETGSARVIVSMKDVPKECVFKGSVVGEQGDFFTGAFTSNKNLAAGAMNDMKNEAVKLGANYVQLETNQAGYTSSGSNYGQSGRQTDVTNTGNAYYCPPELIGLG